MSAATPPARLPRPATILVVDDEAHIVQVLSLKLRNAGYAVIAAVDGEEGLEVALRQKPDLIITDVQMPYVTGLELCKSLRGDERTAGIPVILLTARGHSLEREDLEWAAASNICDVLSKPFSPRAIVERIGEILAERSVDGLAPGRAGSQRRHKHLTSDLDPLPPEDGGPA